MIPFVRLPVLARLLAVLCCGLGAARAAEPATLRVGFFPNLTHAPALAARQLEREQADWHRSRLPAGTRLEWRAFNAGPSAMEALLAGAVDVTYVGPSPALNAHVRTKGAEIRVLATVARAGNALVVRKGAGLATPADFRGRRLGTPQLGNTQDIDARVWLRSGGLRVHLGGGDAQVVPAQNAELMLLFSRGDIDAVWTVEPWVTRLTEEFGGEILVEKKEAPITLLVTSVSALGRRRAEIEAFVRSHQALRDQLLADRPDYERLVRAGLSAETRSTPPTVALVHTALGRVVLDPREDTAARKARLAASFTRSLQDACDTGLLRGDIALRGLLDELVPDEVPAAK